MYAKKKYYNIIVRGSIAFTHIAKVSADRLRSRRRKARARHAADPEVVPRVRGSGPWQTRVGLGFEDLGFGTQIFSRARDFEPWQAELD